MLSVGGTNREDRPGGQIGRTNREATGTPRAREVTAASKTRLKAGRDNREGQIGRPRAHRDPDEDPPKSLFSST